MKNLFDPARGEEIKQRLATLTPASTAQWGKMNVAQAMAHCAEAMEIALGEKNPPRMPIGYVFGPLIRYFALRDDAPIRRNTPTAPSLIVADQRDLDVERQRLVALIDRLVADRSVSTHPHIFFGKLTPDQWAVMMYKHADHHLRQFGA